MNIRTLTPLRRGWVATVLAAAVLVSLACVAVITYYITKEVTEGIFVPGHFFGYFTVHMGLLFAATYIAYAALRPWHAHRSERRNTWLKRVEIVRFCVTVYAIIIPFVYYFVVSPPSQWEFNNGWTVIHLIMPVVAVVAWLNLPYAATISLKWTFVPMGYLVLFAAWSLLHGAIASDHWFPYFFLDFVTHGWGMVWIYTILLFAGISALSLVWCMISLNRIGKVSH